MEDEVAARPRTRRTPRSVKTLFARARIEVALMFDAAIYAHRLTSMAELYPGRSSAVGVFSLDDLALAFDGDGLAEACLEKLGRQPLSVDHLRRLKNVMATFLHELLHSVGPEDGALMLAEGYGSSRPTGRVLCEGLNELATGIFLNDFLIAVGIAQHEPRILGIGLDHSYPAEVRRVQALTEYVAQRLGIDHKELVRQLVRQGYGDRARALMHAALVDRFVLGHVDRPTRGRISLHLGRVLADALTGEIPVSQIGAKIDFVLDLSRFQGPLASTLPHATTSAELRVPVPVLVARDGKIVRPRSAAHAAHQPARDVLR